MKEVFLHNAIVALFFPTHFHTSKGDETVANNPNWIDFKELRSKLKFSEVLKHYNVPVTNKGDRAVGFCPLPTHQGKRKSPSFSVELERGIWQCFGCQAKGNVLDFACRMEGSDPGDPRELRKAALKIKDIFLVRSTPPNEEMKPKEVQHNDHQQVIVNAPIDFELQTLDPDHPYLRERGFLPETIERFGLGFCNRGMLKGRVAIPLHDSLGTLVGYAGRLTKDNEVSDTNPKYKLPGSRERNGVILEFHKSLLVYGLHRLPKKCADLIVVEGFPSVWWLWQHEYRNAVAIMGADCSNEQAKRILERVEPDGRIWIMPDGNDAGKRCAESLLVRLSPYRFVRWVRLEKDEQPTDCGIEELQALLSA